MAWVTSNFCEQYFLDTTTTSYIDDDDFVQDKSFARHLSAVNWRSKLGLTASASTRRGLDKRYQFLKEKNSVKSREEFFELLTESNLCSVLGPLSHLANLAKLRV